MLFFLAILAFHHIRKIKRVFMKNLPIFISELETHSFYWDLMDKIGFVKNPPLHRLCSLMRKMEAKSYILEKINSPNIELRNEIKALDDYFGTTGESDIYRISFFSCCTDNNTFRTLSANSCCCSAILIKYKNKQLTQKCACGKSNLCSEEITYLYEAYISYPKLNNSELGLLNNYIHTGRTYTIDVLNRKDFVVEEGTYFCQQNGYTSVCAHSALKMIINSIKHNLIKNSNKLTTDGINKTIGCDHKHKKADTGLDIEDLDKVLKTYGLKTVVGNFFQKPEWDFGQYLYCIIESGYPALLKITTEDEFHAIAVIGHTLNSDEWFPEASFGYIGPEVIISNRNASFSYLSSSRWVDHYIIHDDNYGMYYCLGATCLRKITLPKYDPKLRVHSVIGICPEEMSISPSIIEQNGAKIINDFIQQIYKETTAVWGRKLYETCVKNNHNEYLLLRTLLLNRENYIEHLSKLEDHKKQTVSEDILYLVKYLPEKFWMIEFTLPNLYTANKSKLGEATFYIDQDENDLNKLLISFRGPESFIIRVDNNKQKDKPFIIINNEKISSHCPLYRIKNIKLPQEW